jgi:hydroxyquinol 1,2-dioxygenase
MDSQTPQAVQHVYDDADLITQEVLERYGQTPDPRLREIMLSLIRHLHGFARDVKLTGDEWLFAMNFLQETGKWCGPGRNEFIIFSDALGLSMLTITQAYQRPQGATEPTLRGPFLIENAPVFEVGADIGAGAQGAPLFAQGRVVDAQGKPLAGATVDVWHSDERGLYDVQDGLETRGPWARAQMKTGADGRYAFWSVLPVDYPVPEDGTAVQMLRATTGRTWRPAHLHFRIQAPGQQELITHVFDRRSKHLDGDAVFGVRPSLVADFEHRAAGTAPDGKPMERDYYTLDYDFVMAAA